MTSSSAAAPPIATSTPSDPHHNNISPAVIKSPNGVSSSSSSSSHNNNNNGPTRKIRPLYSDSDSDDDDDWGDEASDLEENQLGQQKDASPTLLKKDNSPLLLHNTHHSLSPQHPDNNSQLKHQNDIVVANKKRLFLKEDEDDDEDDYFDEDEDENQDSQETSSLKQQPNVSNNNNRPKLQLHNKASKQKLKNSSDSLKLTSLKKSHDSPASSESSLDDPWSDEDSATDGDDKEEEEPSHTQKQSPSQSLSFPVADLCELKKFISMRKESSLHSPAYSTSTSTSIPPQSHTSFNLFTPLAERNMKFASSTLSSLDLRKTRPGENAQQNNKNASSFAQWQKRTRNGSENSTPIVSSKHRVVKTALQLQRMNSRSLPSTRSPMRFAPKRKFHSQYETLGSDERVKLQLASIHTHDNIKPDAPSPTSHNPLFVPKIQLTQEKAASLSEYMKSKQILQRCIQITPEEKSYFRKMAELHKQQSKVHAFSQQDEDDSSTHQHQSSKLKQSNHNDSFGDLYSTDDRPSLSSTPETTLVISNSSFFTAEQFLKFLSFIKEDIHLPFPLENFEKHARITAEPKDRKLLLHFQMESMARQFYAGMKLVFDQFRFGCYFSVDKEYSSMRNDILSSFLPDTVKSPS